MVKRPRSTFMNWQRLKAVADRIHRLTKMTIFRSKAGLIVPFSGLEEADLLLQVQYFRSYMLATMSNTGIGGAVIEWWIWLVLSDRLHSNYGMNALWPSLRNKTSIFTWEWLCTVFLDCHNSTLFFWYSFSHKISLRGYFCFVYGFTC